MGRGREGERERKREQWREGERAQASWTLALALRTLLPVDHNEKGEGLVRELGGACGRGVLDGKRRSAAPACHTLA